MQVSYRWLQELLPPLTASAEVTAERLAAGGLAVDGVTRFGAPSDVLLVEVRTVEPHPKRENLQLVTVDRGGTLQRVVCGAKNVPAPGHLVVLAPLGAKLAAFPEPLAPRELGGVISEGMLCSESELGLAEEAEGILVFAPGTAAPGTPFVERFPESTDTIFTLDVTANRPDALGHLGLARELAAAFGLPFERPVPSKPARAAKAALNELVKLENTDLERCAYYAAGAVLDVNVAASPNWLRYRLTSLGIRPISNVVDITNLLLMLYGQPLHAFDLDRVRGGRIVVRRAHAGEPFTTLDGIARKLDEDDLVIADAEGPSALAGVMGGADSEIRTETRRVLLECAYFAPRGVRRASRRHGLRSESSHRFERGVDYLESPHVLEHAKSLLGELCGGSVVEGALEAKGTLPELPLIRLRSARLAALLGVEVAAAEIRTLLGALGFRIVREHAAASGEEFEVRGASYRPDVTIEVDLIEEISRLRGLDRIPTRLPTMVPQVPRAALALEQETLQHALALGLSEALTYSFVSPKALSAVRAPAATVRIENPLTEERSVMRTSLLPGLLEALGRARRRGETRARLFTLGSCFGAPIRDVASDSPRPRRAADVGNLPQESQRFAAILAGPRGDYLSLKEEEVDVWDAKAVAIELVERLSGKQSETVSAKGRAHAQHLHPRGAADIMVEGVRVGGFGPLHPEVVDAFDLGGSAQVVEIDLETLGSLGKRAPRYQPIPKLPAVTRDLSLVVADSVPAGNVSRSLSFAGGELCERVELLGTFSGGSVPEGHRSLTFRVVYRDPKARIDAEGARTLTDKEVDEAQSRMLTAASGDHGATLRS